MKRTVLQFVSTLLLCVSAVAQNPVKFIDLSWANPTVDFLEKNLQAMEAKAPLDGLVIRVTGKKTTRNNVTFVPGAGNAWSKYPWEYEDFTEAIKRIKALKFKRFTDNFFYVTTAQADHDWFSDDDWATVVSNFGIAARISREVGFKGMLVDIEEYGRHFWNAEDYPEIDRPDNEFSQMAFKRGEQWGRAVFTAYPDIVLFMPYCLSMGRVGSLTIPFVNGVLAAMTPQARIYDGMEGHSYTARTPDTYPLLQAKMQKLIRRHIRPELQATARGQILLTPGFYLDGIFPQDPEYAWHKRLMPEVEQNGRLDFFRRNLIAASQEAEPYIWLYGEVRAWWDGWEHPRKQGHWEGAEGAAGITDVVRMVRGLGNNELDESKNLIPDAFFKEGLDKWSHWEFEHDRRLPAPGKVELAPGRAVLSNMTRGCLHQTIPIKGGQAYFFSCSGGYVPGAFRGIVSGSLAFKSGEDWMATSDNISLKFSQSGQEETKSVIFIAPANATHVSVQCYAGQQGKKGKGFFTHAFLQELK